MKTFDGAVKQGGFYFYIIKLIHLKKIIKVILIIFAIAFVGAWGYWQYNKKQIVRNAVENVVSKKTDSLYFIHYDSSSIDAVAGNASFYNVTLQSDSLQKQLEQFDTASAEALYNVHIAEVAIRGANIPALVANEKVEATSIRITRPVIYVIESGTKKEKQFSYDDTLAIYKKILGKFNSIHAGEVVIEDGSFNITHKINDPYVSLNGINASVKNITIDSTRDYDNIISYFIKDMNVLVKETVIKDEIKRTQSVFSNLEYNAGQKMIRLGNFRQYNNADSAKIVFDINNTSITGLNTDSFILRKQFKAESLESDGGILTFYRKKSKNTNSDVVEIDNNFFDEALLNKVNIKNTTIVVFNQDKPKDPPFELKKVTFMASEIQHLYSGTSVKNLVSRSNWYLAAEGFSVVTKNKVYKLDIGPFNISKESGKAHIDYFSVKALLSEAAFVKSLKEQMDLYNISINNIDVSGIDAMKLISEQILIAETATIQPVIKVSNDRTIPSFTGNKIGNYPHQLIQKLSFPLYIKKIIAKDGYVSYTERAAKSEQQGTVFFSKLFGTIDNLTNMPTYLAKNNMMVVKGTAKLLGAGNLKTQWNLPLDTKNGSFTISGSLGALNADVLNPLIEPLALASIKTGQIKSVDFTMQGNDNEAKGITTMLYNDLKVEALKADSNELKKRGLISFFANAIVKDDNPKKGGEIRKGEMDLERDKTRSFFNLVWKGIFKAVKRIAIGKNDD